MIFFDFEVFSHDWLVVAIDMINKREEVIINNPERLNTYYHAHKNDIWVGYNVRRYDQYILKAILCGFNPKEINDFMIAQGKPGWQFSNLLNKIPLNAYDVMTSFHGLKQLEGFMGNSIQESSVPFNIDRKLTPEELDETVKYCRHDVEQTIEVFIQRKAEFESHMGLIKMFKLPLSYLGKTKAQLSAIILEARKQDRNDEFEIQFPDTLNIKKYKEVLNWYKNPENRDYSKRLELDVAGVHHVFGWGGIHGAIDKYHGEGYFVNIDVASYYPALMIEYGYLSRNISQPTKYKEIRDRRLELKAQKDPRNEPLKIVLNGTYGAMKDKFNQLYDPRQANNVCVGGQLLLLDLIEKLEDHCQLIQSNTDGLLVKLHQEEDFDLIDDICYEWEKRTRMVLEFDSYRKVFQKDVNNYVIVDFNGGYKSKGGYVKKLDSLDYDLPIVNEAVIEYLLNTTPPEETVSQCNELRKFQKIVKVSSKYSHALYNGEIQNEKCFRVFASTHDKDGTIYKVKTPDSNPEKFANTPEKCFIANVDINNHKVPLRLDKKWYIDLAIKRLEDFGICLK
jgi:DNA polymerase